MRRQPSMAVGVYYCGRLCRTIWPALLLCAFYAPFAQAQPPRTHFVDVGLNFSASFTDRDTGQNSFNGPVPTVVGVGDSVQWVFHYQHSSTSGSCPNGNCTPNGIWDSTILSGPPQTFQRTFSSTGVFPYFCRIHLSGMQGKVIVLSGPEFFLDVTNPSSPGLFPPIPSATAAAGKSGTFTGGISGFLGYTNPVSLSCQNGNPRTPSACPSLTINPDGGGTPVPFNFAVAESVPGDYEFDIVAVGADPAHITRTQRVRLSVVDFTISNLSPGTVSVTPGAASSQVTFQVSTSNFGGFVNLFCNGLPTNGTLFCGFAPPGFFIPPPPPQAPPTNVTLTVNNFGASPGSRSIEIAASTFLNGSEVRTSVPLTVNVIGPATHFNVPTPPASIKKGTPISIVLTAQDLLNSTVTNYTGTIHFSSTDPAALLPVNTAFILSDNGVHNFPVTFNTLGPRLLAVNDVSSPQIQWQSPVIVVEPSTAANNTVAMLSDRGPGNEPFFRDEAVNLEIRVSGASTPTGKVHLFDGITELTPAAGQTLSFLNGTTAHAIVPTLHLRPGGHQLTVVYDGNATFGANVAAFSQRRSPAPRCVSNVCPGSH
jgi:plastocyanin